MKNKTVLFLGIITSFALAQESGDKSWQELAQIVQQSYNARNYEKFLEYSQKALSQAEKQFGKESKQYTTSLNMLAIYYQETRQYKESVPLFLEALEINKALVGENGPLYSIVLFNLATVYQAMGKHEEAEPLYLEVLNKRKSLLGENHPDYATSLHYLAWVYMDMERYKEAEPLYLEALRIRESQLGENHPDYAFSLNHLAGLYAQADRYGEAEPLYLKALSIRKSIHSRYASSSFNGLAKLYELQKKYHAAETVFLEELEFVKSRFGENLLYISVLEDLEDLYDMWGRQEKSPAYKLSLLDTSWETLVHLAIQYSNESDYEKGAEYAQKALSQAEKEFGKESKEYASSLDNLAIDYQEMQQYEEAEPLFLQALEINRTQGDDKNYGLSLHQVAELYRRMGRYQESERFMKTAEKIFKKDLGDHHPDLLHNFAKLYSDMGKHEEAASLLLQALSIRESQVGKNHLAYIALLHELAFVYTDMARFKDAESLLVEISTIAKNTYAEDHPNYAISLSNLAHVYFRMGRYEEAESLLLKILRMKKKQLGDKHPSVANSLHLLASLYHEMGKYEEAESLCLEALKIVKVHFGENHPNYGASLNTLSMIYKYMGRYDKSEPLYLETLKIAKSQLGENRPDYAQALNNLAVFYVELGRYKDAEPLYWQALEIKKSHWGTNHPEYALTLNNLANIFDTMGRYDEAEPLYLEALRIRKSTVGKNHHDYAISLHNLASLYVHMGKNEQAESLLLDALKIKKDLFGEFHPSYAISLNVLASHYMKMGRSKEAEPLFLKSLTIRKNQLGENHPSYATALSNLALLYLINGEYSRAEPLFFEANQNCYNQINTFFPFMSEKEKSQFWNRVNYHFKVFNSFAIQRSNKNSLILSDMYNNHLRTKALLLYSTNKVKRLILKSGDEDLTKTYEKWISKKEYLAKVYHLGKTEIEKRGIDVKSLENEANELEKQLSLKSESFAQITDKKLPEWQDIQRQLKTGEAAVEIIRLRWIDKSVTDEVYYVALIVTSETKEHPEVVILEKGNDLEGKYFKEYLECRRSKNAIAYEQYWQPIKEKLQGIEKVYFSPDGIYKQINLNILPNPETGEYLLDEIDIHLVTNTKDILEFDNEKDVNKRALLFGRPTYQTDSKQHLAAVKTFKHNSRGGSWTTDCERVEREKAYYSDLPGTEVEVNGIAALLAKNGWKTELYLGQEALEEAVKAANNPGILHIATHGFFRQCAPSEFKNRSQNVHHYVVRESEFMVDPPGRKTLEKALRANDKLIVHISGNKTTIVKKQNEVDNVINADPMLRSGLVMAGAMTYLQSEQKYATEDGILTAYEAMNLNLDNTSLVVLSACETAVGEVRNGEGVYGLQRAFKVAGAKSILMSLWNVKDEATQELMTEFYTQWIVNGNEKRQAFKIAQQKIREKYEEPYLWGGFVMVGE